jgi:hypothetical protein
MIKRSPDHEASPYDNFLTCIPPLIAREWEGGRSFRLRRNDRDSRSIPTGRTGGESTRYPLALVVNPGLCLLLLFQNLPDCPLREKNVVLLLEIGSEPTLTEPGFLPDLLQQLNARFRRLTWECVRPARPVGETQGIAVGFLVPLQPLVECLPAYMEFVRYGLCTLGLLVAHDPCKTWVQ